MFIFNISLSIYHPLTKWYCYDTCLFFKALHSGKIVIAIFRVIKDHSNFHLHFDYRVYSFW